MKLVDVGIQNGEQWIAFHCPGCEGSHSIPVTGIRAWYWNGSLERPTLRPSIFVNRGSSNPTIPACHSCVTDGRIQFLSGCTHSLAGKTVGLPDWDE
ncbi:MAG: DUF6527 family protein [Candidatus Acidiferrales bacterium]